MIEGANLLGEVHRIRMMAPGKRTLFLKGRIPRRLGSSTDSAMFGSEEKRTVILQREREEEDRWRREGGKCYVCGLVLFGLVWFGWSWRVGVAFSVKIFKTATSCVYIFFSFFFPRKYFSFVLIGDSELGNIFMAKILFYFIFGDKGVWYRNVLVCARLTF